MAREYIFEWVEIDLPLCNRVWGTAPCTAALGGIVKRKCWNLRFDCAAPLAYNPVSTLTLKFFKDGPKPKGFNGFPVLSSVKASSPEVNIAGSDPQMSDLGRLATLDFELADFTYHERGIDPYQAERVTGAAQLSGIGYLPEKQGTFLNKLRSRWPEYSNARVRYSKAYLENDALNTIQTQNYFLKEMDGPNDGSVSVSATGVLDLANAKTALCPKPSNGRLTLDISAGVMEKLVSPAGVGSEYPTSGFVCLGNEVCSFTRSGNSFTVSRGQSGTVAAARKQGDTVQLVYSVTNGRLDDVMTDLVQNYTQTPASYLDAGQIAENAAEVTRWGASIFLNTKITTPTPVATLLAELSDLGCTIREDEFTGKIKIKMNAPVNLQTVRKISDRKAKSITQKDNDAQRLTQVLFMHKRTDPTKAMDDDSNYQIKLLTVDPEALALYGNVVKNRTIRTRWLDQGDTSTVSIASLRLLQRFKRAPKRVTAVLDADQRDVRLVDVVQIDSDELADGDGLPKTQYMQVIRRSEPVAYHEVEVLLQSFGFTGRFGFIAPNTVTNTYLTATDFEKLNYAFISPNSDIFADGSEAYKVI
jgi:hypothetical protein